MSNEGGPLLAGLPPDKHPCLEALMASDSPAAPSASLSPYGLQDMTAEEFQRYERSAGVSPANLRHSQRGHTSYTEAIYPPTPAFRLVSERATGAMHRFTLVTSAKEEEEEEGQITSEPSIGHGGDQIDETSIVSPKRKISPAPPLMHPFQHSTDEADQRVLEATTDGTNEIALEPSISENHAESRKRKKTHSPDLDVAPLSKPKGPGIQEVSRFRGAIVCRSLKDAITFAKNIGKGSPRTRRVHRHIFWTDASIVFRACAAGAVVWKQPPNWDWRTEGFPYPYCIQSTDVVEMFAMAHALRRAVDEVEMSLGGVSDGSQSQIRHEVYVFTDSVGALTQVEWDSLGYHTPETCQQAHTIIDFSTKLHDLGVKVELHLVPGHNNVPGNVQAHQAAKNAAKSAAAAAGIVSPEQGAELYKTQRGVAIFAPATDGLVPASQVPARFTRRSKTQRASMPPPLSLSSPSISKPFGDASSLVLVSPLHLSGQLGRLREPEERLSHLFSDSDFVRPDRTPNQSPEPTPTPGSGFTSINAGTKLSPRLAPLNKSLKLSKVDAAAGIASEPIATSEPSQVQSSRPAKRIRREENNSPAPLTKMSSAPGQGPFHWFIPISARSSLSTAGPSQLISLSSPKSVTGKQAELGIVGAEYPEYSPGLAFGQAPVASSLHQKLPSDKATVSLQARKFSFDLTNKAPATCLEPATLVAPPLSFALASKMRSFASPTEPDGKLTLDLVSPFSSRELSRLPSISPSRTMTRDASTLDSAKLNMQSFASPGRPGDDFSLSPLLSFDGGETKHDGEMSLPSLRSVALNMPQATKMSPFASPGECKDALPLRPIPAVCQSEEKYPINTSLSFPLSSTPGICSSFTPFVNLSKMRSFASPVEPMDGLTLTPISTLPKSGPANSEATLPTFGSSQPRIFDTAGSVVSITRMRSVASPVEPTDGLTLRSISSLPKGELARTKAMALSTFHPSSPVGFDAASPILSTKKMRSFASPEEPVDGLMLAPISSTHTSRSASLTPSKARNKSQEGKGIQP